MTRLFSIRFHMKNDGTINKRDSWWRETDANSVTIYCTVTLIHTHIQRGSIEHKMKPQVYWKLLRDLTIFPVYTVRSCVTNLNRLHRRLVADYNHDREIVRLICVLYSEYISWQLDPHIPPKYLWFFSTLPLFIYPIIDKNKSLSFEKKRGLKFLWNFSANFDILSSELSSLWFFLTCSAKKFCKICNIFAKFFFKIFQVLSCCCWSCKKCPGTKLGRS